MKAASPWLMAGGLPVALFFTSIIPAAAQLSPTQCQQALAQIQEFRSALPAYESRGQSGMAAQLREGIRVNQQAYNNGCRGAGSRGGGAASIGSIFPAPTFQVPESRAGRMKGASARVRSELDGMDLDGPAPRRVERREKPAANKTDTKKAEAKKAESCDGVEQVQRFNFDKEWRIAADKKTIFKELKASLEQLQKQLRVDVPSEFRQATAIVLRTAKVTGDLITGLHPGGASLSCGLNMGIAVSSAVIEEIAATAGQEVYTAVKSGGSVAAPLLRTVTSGVDAAWAEAKSCVGIPLGGFNGALANLVSGINDLATMQEEWEASKRELSVQVEKITAQIKATEAKIVAAENWQRIREKALEGAQRACSEKAVQVHRLN